MVNAIYRQSLDFHHMQSILKITITVYLLLTMFSSASLASQREMTTLTVLADSSLGIPISQIAVQYSHTNNVSISTVFQSPSMHQKNIEDGEPADLLITADADLIAQLTQKGLADVKSPTVLGSDRLILAATLDASSPDLTKDVLNDNGMTDYDSKTLVTLNPEMFAEGKIAQLILGKSKKSKMYLVNLSISPSIQDAINSLMEPNRIGIIPSSVIRNTTIRKIGDLPELTSTIHYTGLVVASENMEKARALLAYMSSDEAKAILKDAGFK